MEDVNNTNNKQAADKQTAAGRSSVLFIILGWIFAVLSLFIYPFIFGVFGIIMGILSTKNGSRTGLSLIIASIILMGIGLVFSGVILNYTRRYLGI